MSLFNQLIPSYVLNDKHQIRVAPQMQEPVYIDDVFDPLFNKRAQDYLNAKYGRFLRIPGGYAEMLENMLGNSTKQWGPLGPGMGILGTFGRTIDKAEDFLLGGITEASHLGGNLNPLGSYTPVKNPLREVFVEDKDYTGQKLLASMSNNMSKLAGGTALTENDFNGMWNVPSLGIEIATDPGILGGSLSRHLAPEVTLANSVGDEIVSPLQKAAQTNQISSAEIMDMLSKETNIKSAVGEAGQLMSNFDDVLAKLSWDITSPGLRPAVGKLINRIDPILPSDRHSVMVNSYIKKLKEVEEGEELLREFEKASKKDTIKRLTIEPSKTVSYYDELDAMLNDIKNFDPFKEDLGRSANISKTFKEASILENVDEVISKFNTITDVDRRNTIIKQLLEDFKETPEIAKPLKAYLNKGTPLPEYFEDAIAENVSTLSKNDAEMLKKLVDFKNQLRTKIYASNKTDYINNLQTMLDLKNKSEEAQINSIKEFQKEIQSTDSLWDLENYIKKYSKEFPVDTPSEKLINEIKDEVKEYLAKNAESYPASSLEEFETLVKQEGTREYAKFNEIVNERLKGTPNLPITITGNRYKIIQQTMQKTGYVPYVEEKFSSLIKKVAKGNQEFEKLLTTAYKEGDFVKFYELLADERSAMRPFFEAYYDLNPILSEQQELLQQTSKTKVNFPYLNNKLVGKSPERFHAKLKDFLDTIFKEDENYAMIDAADELGNITSEIKNINGDIINETDDKIRERIAKSRTFRKHSLLDAQNLIARHLTEESDPEQLAAMIKDLRDVYDMVNLVEIGAKEDVINDIAKDVTGYLQTLKMSRIDPFLKIGEDGSRGFNYELFYHIKKAMPYYEIKLNPEILKNYNVTAKDVYEIINTKFPPLADFKYEIGDTFYKEFKNPIIKDVKGKLTLIKGEDVNSNTITNLFELLNSKGTPEELTKFMSDETREAILKANKQMPWYRTYLNNKYLAIQDMLENSTAEEIKYFFNETPNPSYIQAADALSKYTGIPTEQIKERLDEIRHTIQENTEEARLFTKLDIITNNGYNLDRHKETFASVRQTQKQLKKVENIHFEFNQNYLKAHPTAKSEEVSKAWKDFCFKYQTTRDKMIGDIVSKDNFLNEFIDAHGIMLSSAKAGTEKPLINAIYHNARVINHSNQLVIPFSKRIGDRVYVGLKVNADNPEIIKLFKKDINLKTQGFQDIVFANPENIELAKDFENIHSAINEINDQASKYYKTIGFTNATIDYNKHLYTFSTESERALTKLYKDLGIDDIEKIRRCGATLQEMYNKHGAFMTFNTAKSLRGNIADWNSLGNIFETDLDKVAKSTLTDGIFDNHKIQLFIDLCLNENTKVSSYANDWKHLKEIIHAKDYYGNASGNLKNMTLASCVFNEDTGAFVKFKKYDMLTDKGIKEAFENNAFYVPTNMFAMLDKMVKKDAKMSNKLYAFINKYLMLPFKFGTLANPGFLVGNFSDAYMKQALTLSQKYGTSVAEEMAKVSESLMDIIHLNDNFSEIYRNKFLPSLGEQAVKDMPLLKVPSNAFADPKVGEKFISWYKTNKALLPKAEQKSLDLMMYINKYIPTMTGDLTAFDLEDVAKFSKGKQYEVPRSFVEKRLMGNHYNSKNITTWGILAGNPISSAVMRASGYIETLFRSASVLNDLKHSYKNTDNLLEAIGLDAEIYAKRHRELTAKTLDAINLMNAANFNYDNISEFMQKVSYFMPFPTFYLKNLGYWLEVLEEHPEYIDTIINTQNTMWHGIDTTKDNFQAEAKGRGSLPMSSIIGQKPSKVFKGVLKPTMTNSMFSAFSTINNPLKDVANRVNPIASPLTRHLQEPENVRYRPYSTDPYEKNIKQGDKNFNKLTYTFHRLNPYDRFLNTYLRTPAKIKTNQAQMSDFLPSIFQPDYSRKEKAKK